MAKPLVPDDLWHSIEPLLPAPKPRRFRFPGRQPIDDRTVLTGILFVLKPGIPWADFPGERGCCGMTLHKRLSQWQRLGVWDAIHRRLLDQLRGIAKIDCSRVVVDSASVRAVHGGGKNWPQPGGSAQGRYQTPPRGRGRGRAFGHSPARRANPCCEPIAATCRGHRADPRSRRRTASQAQAGDG